MFGSRLSSLVLALFFLSACSTAAPKNERYGFWVDEHPWRGTRLDNRNIKKPYRQCVEKLSMRNITCKE